MPKDKGSNIHCICTCVMCMDVLLVRAWRWLHATMSFVCFTIVCRDDAGDV